MLLERKAELDIQEPLVSRMGLGIALSRTLLNFLLGFRIEWRLDMANSIACTEYREEVENDDEMGYNSGGRCR